ncbi:transmembrane protein 254 isoform X3 [Ochotona curzoniae]|uniref:transmembrane protein 254 isoform X3 n=1 Tax=Ochotona curzoniae TaxID=130825 RepID=UPI001B34CA37|nr:transmembrane protein 254 isoform X3 [Ochotona curzoniae]
MVVAKSETRRDASAYFRTARPVPSLITGLGLGFFAVLACLAGSRGRVCVRHGAVQVNSLMLSLFWQARGQISINRFLFLLSFLLILLYFPLKSTDHYPVSQTVCRDP